VAAVSNYRDALQSIIEAGIEPSERVRKAADDNWN